MSRWHLRIFRAVFSIAWALSAGLAGLIIASLLLADGPTTAPRYVAISLTVSAILLGLAVLLFGIKGQTTALARAIAAHGEEMQGPLSRLATFLLLAGAGLVLLLAGLIAGVIARILDGAAVFG